jgi:hypothetical protein
MSIFLIGSLITLIGILFGIERFEITQQNNRLDKFEKDFFDKYENDGCVLECLIPAGINNLKNEKEIKKVLNRLQNRLGFHPLRNLDEKINIIGYKKFFLKVKSSKKILNKDTIIELISEP